MGRPRGGGGGRVNRKTRRDGLPGPSSVDKKSNIEITFLFCL